MRVCAVVKVIILLVLDFFSIVNKFFFYLLVFDWLSSGLVDGTTNFAHGYPSFAVSVGVLFRGKPAAASVVSSFSL